MPDPIRLASLAVIMLVTLGNTAPAPLRLVTEPVDGGVRVRVVAQSAVACDARYSLEVSSSTVAGNNSSVQSGATRILPGAEKTVATLTLGNVQPGGWSARLVVDPCAPGKRYEEVSGSTR